MTLLLFIVAPQSLEFINKVISNLCEKLHIDQRISSAYHPQTNGLDERFNQTLIRSLQKVVGICVSSLFCLHSLRASVWSQPPLQLKVKVKRKDFLPMKPSMTLLQSTELCRDIRSAKIEVA